MALVLPSERNGDFGTSPFYGQHSERLLTWGAEREAQGGLPKIIYASMTWAGSCESLFQSIFLTLGRLAAV